MAENNMNESDVTIVNNGDETSTGVTGNISSSGGGALKIEKKDFSFHFDQDQMEQMWQEMAAKIESSITVTDEKEEDKEASWNRIEKTILKGYQSQAKKLAMQVARLEFMLKTLTQQMEANFSLSFQAWSNHFNANLNDLFVSRVPRIVSDQVNLTSDSQAQEVKNLVIQQMQTELNDRIESVVNLKTTNQAQEIKASVLEQMQTELEQRIENVINVKIADQAQQINASVVDQMSNDIDQRIDNALNVKIANQAQQIGDQVIQQIQNDIDRRVDSVVSLKISDQAQNVKNLVIQEMQSYVEQRIDSVVNLKIANQAKETNTQVVHQIQSDMDRRIESIVNLKIDNYTPKIKSLVVQQIESDFDRRVKSVVNQSTDNNVQSVVSKVLNDLDKRIDANFDNKFLNFRNELPTIVNKEINQNFAEPLKTTILGDIKKQPFYVDMHSIKAEVENFYARLGQFENQMNLRVEQGDTQLYNWTLEQLIALQGCLTDRQALVDMFEVFASNLKDELNNAECVLPSRFTPWVRRTSQAQLDSTHPQQLPSA